MFGGESHADLSDLWGFDFRTNLWKEITFNKDVSPG